MSELSLLLEKNGLTHTVDCFFGLAEPTPEVSDFDSLDSFLAYNKESVDAALVEADVQDAADRDGEDWR